MCNKWLIQLMTHFPIVKLPCRIVMLRLSSDLSSSWQSSPSVAVEYLSIAAFLMNPAAYVPLAKILKDTGLVEQAMGYANVAVSKNIPGSADVVISLLGLDGVQMGTTDQEMDEET